MKETTQSTRDKFERSYFQPPPEVNVDGSNNWDYATFESYLAELDNFDGKDTFNGKNRRNPWTAAGITWAGGTLKGTLELARKGWPDGIKHMSRFTTKITERVKASLPIQTQFWDTSGLDFDMGSVLSGNPECWYDYAPKEEMKFVRIGVNGFFSFGISDNHITMRGGAICAIIDALESINYRVELDVLQAATDYNGYADRIRIKNFQDALDLDRLAFVTTHKAMFRVLTGHHAMQKTNRSDLWYANENHPWFKGYDIYFPAMIHGDDQWSTFEKAERFILEILRKQGVELQTKNEWRLK